MDRERGFVGAAPPAELSSSILALARRVSSSGTVHTEALPLAPGPGGEPGAVRLLARPAGGGVVAVASHPLGAAAEAEETLSRFELVMRATHEAVWDWSTSTGPWWNRQQYELLGDEQGRLPRVLDCSGHTEDAVVRQSGHEARTGFLPKPYTRETLLERVRTLLDADD